MSIGPLLQAKAVQIDEIRHLILTRKELWDKDTVRFIQSRLQNAFKYAPLFEKGEIVYRNANKKQVVLLYPHFGKTLTPGDFDANIQIARLLVFELLQNGNVRVYGLRKSEDFREEFGISEQKDFFTGFLTEEYLGKFMDKIIAWEQEANN